MPWTYSSTHASVPSQFSSPLFSFMELTRYGFMAQLKWRVFPWFSLHLWIQCGPEVAALSLSGWPPTAGLVLDLKSSCYVSSSWLHVSQGHTSHRLCLVNDSVEDKGRSILADSGPCKVWLCLTVRWVLIDLPETEQKSRKPSPTCSSFCLSDLHHDPTASQISPFPPCIHSQAFPLGKALHI